jgi:hypothetical protein
MNLLTSSEKIEKIFDKYFQKNIILYINDEPIKKGKFLLIKNCIISNNFFFEFTIKREKKIDVIRVPYPFKIEEYVEDNLIYMDYRISSLFKNRPEIISSIQRWIEEIDPKSPNKLFNNILEIKFE